jgi:hypothetical protein
VLNGNQQKLEGIKLVTTIFHQIFRGKTRTASMALLAFVIAITGMSFTGGGAAHADVPRGQIKHIYMNISNNPGYSLQSQYRSLIESLRVASGHGYRDGVRETELNDHHQSTGMIKLTLTIGDRTLTLWISPYNLYLRGFTNMSGHTFQFNDSEYNLYDTLNGLPGHPTGGYTTLPFDSGYTGMSHAAQRSRQQMPIYFGVIFTAISDLATNSYSRSNYNRDIARDLMMMVQFTSEAARLNNVLRLMTRVMGSHSEFSNGLPSLENSLENKWQAISSFGRDVSQNPWIRPRYISPQIGTLYNWRDVLKYLAVILSPKGGH